MHAQAVRTAPLDESLFARAAGEYEQLIDILASFWEDRQRIFSVNLPNQGVIPGLPAEAILELPAAATGRGFLPSHAPARPPALIARIAWRVAAHVLTVEAALIGNCTLWCEALLADGAMTARCLRNSWLQRCLRLIVRTCRSLPEWCYFLRCFWFSSTA